jgi:aryl-alcohol dehydrogenase-like predicted oxidoreductase
MKKLIAVFALVLLASGVLSAQVSRGATAWVASKSAALKSSTWFFAGTRGQLDMGAQVTVLQVSGNWAEVRSSSNTSLSGWTSVSNLSARRIVSTASGASASEIALAGKGFNQEVENAYKAGGSLNYADVDKTEAIAVSPEELLKFVTEGRLFTGEQK